MNLASAMRLSSLVGLLAVLVAVAGCSQFWPARERHEQGWRMATLVQLDAGDLQVSKFDTDCRGVSFKAAAPASTYAVFSYRVADGFRRRVIAPLSAGSLAKVGDAFMVNTRDCTAAPQPQ